MKLPVAKIGRPIKKPSGEIHALGPARAEKIFKQCGAGSWSESEREAVWRVAIGVQFTDAQGRPALKPDPKVFTSVFSRDPETAAKVFSRLTALAQRASGSPTTRIIDHISLIETFRRDRPENKHLRAMLVHFWESKADVVASSYRGAKAKHVSKAREILRRLFPRTAKKRE